MLASGGRGLGDASIVLPEDNEARAPERQRLMDFETEQSRATGQAGSQVRVELPPHRQAVEMARQPGTGAVTHLRAR
jgi:hypothetical protein